MSIAIQPASRIRTFACQPAFSFQEQESLNDLLSRTSRQIAEKERNDPRLAGKKQPKYPFTNVGEIVARLAEYSIDIEDAGGLRTAILKVLNKNDCRDFKKFMKLALRTHRLEADDLLKAESLIDAYEMNENDKQPLYEVADQLKEMWQTQENAKRKWIA